MPALVDFENSILDADGLRAIAGAPALKRSKSRLQQILAPFLTGKNRVASVIVSRILEYLRAEPTFTNRSPRILVIGGGTVGSGLESLYTTPGVEVIGFDIYVSPFVQFVADGHSIPLADASVDGVVIQAVLEHVLMPWQVVQEIHRVLRPDGVVYADTPFMQQVHEGPYDFTRFTDSGHRYLFRQFELIDSGAVAGAGTALWWSLQRFVRALTRSPRLGQLVGICSFWLSRMDPLLDTKHSLDGASGIFFLGRKSARTLTQAEIVDYYRGGMRLLAQPK